MMLAMILAQLVLPWPGLDSPLVQPGPTICVGECAGPVIYGAAERGRLVVACDMRSDTCSDGRKITTTRATPVPCETSPGVWEMVGVDEGCYGVRGLESWGATTSYLSWGAELDRSPWGGQATATKDGANYLVCVETGLAFRQQLASEAGGVVRAAACRVRAGTSNIIRLLAADVSSGGVNFDYTLTDAWQTVTATTTIVEGGGYAGVRLHPSRSGAGCIEVAGCWSTKSDTPGRPCWGGEAPVTCGADVTSISTEGWPTESGEVSITAELGPSEVSRYILDTRTAADGTGFGINLYVTSTGALVAGLCAGTCSNRNTLPLPWGGPTSIRFKWSPTEAKVWVNGVEVLSWTPGVTVVSHRANAHLGKHASGNINHLNGSIRSLTVRSYE